MLTEGLRHRHLVTVLVGTVLVSAVVWHLFTRTGRMLHAPSWLTVVVLLVLAALVVGAGWQVRAYQRGDLKRPYNPLRAARTLGLAQAGALTGAVIAGWYAGHLAILLPDRDLTAYGRQIIPLLAIIAAGGVLAAAGLVAQHWCRLPEDQDRGAGRGDNGADGDGPTASAA